MDRYRFLCLDRTPYPLTRVLSQVGRAGPVRRSGTPYPLTRVLSPFQGDTGRDGRLAERRACAPYGIAMGQ